MPVRTRTLLDARANGSPCRIWQGKQSLDDYFVVINADYCQVCSRLGKTTISLFECGECQWAVHRVILRIGSGFFSKACRRATFRKGDESLIQLNEDDENIVAIVSKYLYARDHSASAGPIDDRHPLEVHAQTYAAADRYDISGLKDFAKAYFEAELAKRYEIENVLPAIEVAYISTLKSHRGIRNCLLKTIESNKKQCRRNEHFVDLFRTLADGDFAMDVRDSWTKLDKGQPAPHAERPPNPNSSMSRMLCNKKYQRRLNT